jgi:hypothetical protein
MRCGAGLVSKVLRIGAVVARARGMRAFISVALALGFVSSACDDQDPAPPPDAAEDGIGACPMDQPAAAATCEVVEVPATGCEYLIERCACGPSDIVWTCDCLAGAWDCSRGYDCYPCGE